MFTDPFEKVVKPMDSFPREMHTMVLGNWLIFQRFLLSEHRTQLRWSQGSGFGRGTAAPYFTC